MLHQRRVSHKAPGTATRQTNPLNTLAHSAVRTAGDIFRQCCLGSASVLWWCTMFLTWLLPQALKVSGQLTMAQRIRRQLPLWSQANWSGYPYRSAITAVVRAQPVAYADPPRRWRGTRACRVSARRTCRNLPSMMLLLRTHGHGRLMAARLTITLTIVALMLSFAVDAMALDMLVEEQMKVERDAGIAQLAHGRKPLAGYACSGWKVRVNCSSLPIATSMAKTVANG